MLRPGKLVNVWDPDARIFRGRVLNKDRGSDVGWWRVKVLRPTRAGLRRGYRRGMRISCHQDNIREV